MADYLLVLGHRLRSGKPSEILIRRLQLACVCYREHTGTRIIVSGGITDGSTVSEAQCMREYLVRAGIPEQDIILEDQAQDTYENILYTSKLVGLETSVCIISSKYHLRRAVAIARKMGYKNVTARGAGVPRAEMLRCYVVEFVACLLYRIQGKTG